VVAANPSPNPAQLANKRHDTSGKEMQEMSTSRPRFSLSQLPPLPQLARSLNRLVIGHWRVIGVGVVAVGVIVFGAVVLLRPFAPPALPLRTITDVPLPGGATRFDYQSLDPLTHRLFVAHLGSDMVTVVDIQSNRVVANLTGIAGVHGVLAIPALGRVYASATDAQQVVVIDERTLRVVARIPGGTYPDGLAYAAAQHEVFVSDEAGSSDLVIDTQSDRLVATIPLGGESAIRNMI
jgi:YVTN family beta-propeller protein